MFTDVRSVAQIAPGGIFFDTVDDQLRQPVPVGAASARRSVAVLRPAGERSAGRDFLTDPNVVPLYIGRRNVEGGGRQQDFHNSSFRGLIGSRGDIADGWSYDVSTQFSRTSATTAHVEQLLDPEDPARAGCRRSTPMATSSAARWSTARIRTVSRTTSFAVGGITPEALNYISAPGLQIGTIDQNVTQGVITGDLGTIGAKLPWADEPIKVAFGVENRRDKLTNTPDDLQAQALLSGSGGATIGIAGLDQRERRVHGSEHSAGAGQDVRRASVVRHGVSLLRLQLGHPDGHVQVRC